MNLRAALQQMVTQGLSNSVEHALTQLEDIIWKAVETGAQQSDTPIIKMYPNSAITSPSKDDSLFFRAMVQFGSIESLVIPDLLGVIHLEGYAYGTMIDCCRIFIRPQNKDALVDLAKLADCVSRSVDEMKRRVADNPGNFPDFIDTGTARHGGTQ